MHSLISLGTLAVAVSSVTAFTSYIAQFIPVQHVLDMQITDKTAAAQATVILGAQWWDTEGPWSVRNKSFLAPSNSPGDWLSWSPYAWPDCSNVQNTTELTPQQVWKECNYVTRDGLFAPDVRLVNNTGDAQAMSDGVFYSALAYRITKDEKYAANVARYIDVWFLNNATNMNPNLNYAQVLRGANGSGMGQHWGVLDMHGMSKVASAVLLLRAMGSSSWTSTIDQAFDVWCTQYVQWLTTSPIALGEKAAPNNHGSFYFAQTASLQVLIGNNQDARETLTQYYQGIFKGQIAANGDQPLESARTRPYHYLAYNGAALITMARIAEYIGWDTWGMATPTGGTLQKAVDYAMAYPSGKEDVTELYSNVAAIASHFGDPTGKYAAWLAQKNPLYPAEAYFFWEQPLSDSGLKVEVPSLGSATNTNGTSSGSSGDKNAADRLLSLPRLVALVLGAIGVTVALAL